MAHACRQQPGHHGTMAPTIGTANNTWTTHGRDMPHKRPGVPQPCTMHPCDTLSFWNGPCHHLSFQQWQWDGKHYHVHGLPRQHQSHQQAHQHRPPQMPTPTINSDGESGHGTIGGTARQRGSQDRRDAGRESAIAFTAESRSHRPRGI